MKKNFLIITAISFLFVGCTSTNSSISPDKIKYEKIETTKFKGGDISSEFLFTDFEHKTGTLRKYGYNGKVTSNTNIVNGVKSGYEILYDPTGNILKKTPYITGYKEGTEFIYYPGGKTMVTIPYKANVKHGKAIAYNIDGSINKTASYKKGKRIK